MATKLTMIYFPVRARTEPAKMIAAFGELNLNETDCQGYFDCDFVTAKMGGKLPFGQLPVLAADDILIGQSGSINRFLASMVKTPEFIPSDPVKAALADALHETSQDLAMIMPIVNLGYEEDWAASKEDYFKFTLPGKLPALVKILGTQQYFCGDNVSYADFAIYHIMDLVRFVEPGVISEHNNITAWMSRVEQLPGVKEYLNSRPPVIRVSDRTLISEAYIEILKRVFVPSTFPSSQIIHAKSD